MKNLLIYCIVFSSIHGIAQVQNSIKIGEKIDGLVIQNVEHFEKKKITTKDLLGKWTILDFWTTDCTACQKSYPNINELQKKFTDIQFLLITNNGGRYTNVHQVYERFRKNMKLELPVAYDSLLFRKFEIRAVPFIVILDPKGRVHSLPSGVDLTEENLNKLITNKPLSFVSQPNGKKEIWASWVNGNEVKENNDTFRSVLTPYQNEFSTGNIELDADTSKGLYQVTKALASRLYMVARNWYKLSYPFSSEYWPEAIFEKEKVNVSGNASFDPNAVFNYSLLVPNAISNEHLIRQRLELDLNTYFGTNVTVETRIMPYWSLSALPESAKRLVSKEITHKYEGGPTGLTAHRVTVMNIISLIGHYFGDNLPVVDETGIQGKIDIQFEAVMTDIDEVQRALKKQGLILEQKSKPMKVLIIKDRQRSDLLTSKSYSHEK